MTDLKPAASRAPRSPIPCLRFQPGGLTHPDVQALLRAHLLAANEHSPADSIHALDSGGLQAPNTQFWSVWSQQTLVGMCALKSLDAQHAEIKSMRTVDHWRRCGVGDAMMQHLLITAAAAGCQRLSLETGTAPAYAAAHRLYARHGFVPCPPFAAYQPDPHSCYMTRRLSAADGA